VVIDLASVARRPIGATAWSMVKDREYDDQDENKGDVEQDSLARILLEKMGFLADGKKKPYGEDDEEELNGDEERVAT
jgi:hypothetical protein